MPARIPEPLAEAVAYSPMLSVVEGPEVRVIPLPAAHVPPTDSPEHSIVPPEKA